MSLIEVLLNFTTGCPKGTTMQELVNVEGACWRIEECFKTAKMNGILIITKPVPDMVGIGASLLLLAYAVMASARCFVQEIRRLVAKLS